VSAERPVTVALGVRNDGWVRSAAAFVRERRSRLVLEDVGIQVYRWHR